MIKSAGRLVIVLLAAALILTGCGVDADSPEGVVKRFFEQLEDRNETEVKNLLCQDFRQNVHFNLGDEGEARLRTDLKYNAEDDDGAETLDVKVHGRIQAVWETDHVRQEITMWRDEETAWTIRLFKVDGEWLVCGGDPFVLTLLDLEAAVNTLEE